MGGWDDKPLGEGRSTGKHTSKFPVSSLTKTVCSVQQQELLHLLILITTKRIGIGLKAEKHTPKFQSEVKKFKIYALRKQQCHDSVLKTNSNLLLSLLSQGAASCLCKHVKVITRITVLEGAECATDTVCAQVCNQRRKNSEPVK